MSGDLVGALPFFTSMGSPLSEPMWTTLIHARSMPDSEARYKSSPTLASSPGMTKRVIVDQTKATHGLRPNFLKNSADEAARHSRLLRQGREHLCVDCDLRLRSAVFRAANARKKDLRVG